jgi:putative transposase
VPKRSGAGQPVGQDNGKRGVKGWDGFKKVRGRKRHLLVDSQGLLMGVHITAAHIQDRAGAAQLLKRYAAGYPQLQVIWADRNYSGLFPAYAWNAHRLRVEITQPQTLPGGRVASKKRWVVERTFAWLGRSRRLSKDYEYLVSTSEAWIYLAMSRLMVSRLPRSPG